VSQRTIGPNSYVTLDYVLRSPKGDVIDDSKGEGGEPIDYVHGYGMLVPGLEAGLEGLKEGDEKQIAVSAAEGFGERDDALVMEVERSEFPHPDKLSVGDEFVAESPDGDEVDMKVVEVRADIIRVDANHPLAGMDLAYEVKIRTIRDATEDEIAEAAEEFEDARAHVHGPDCNHDHGDLVPLRVNKPS
jgi:FKBP-type peptidyl-prolyl cis-trans isomerase SlyD